MDRLSKYIYLILSMIIISTSTCFAVTPNSSGYVTVDHGKLYYEKYGAGSPVLVIHGGPGLDQGYLKPQLLAIAKSHEVIFYDQRGSGKSLETVMDRTSINLEQFTDDIEAIRKSLGLENIIVLGHSWGGLLAMKYAIKYPGHLAKLILLDTMPADINGIMSTADELEKRLEPIKDEVAPLSDYEQLSKLNAEQIAALYRKYFSVYFYNPNDAEKLTINLSVESALSGLMVQGLMQQDMFINLFPQLKRLTIPTTIILGEQDIVPLWTSEAIAKAIPNAKLVVIPNCGHFPYIEKTDEFLLAI